MIKYIFDAELGTVLLVSAWNISSYNIKKVTKLLFAWVV